MQDLIKKLEKQRGKKISEFNKVDWKWITFYQKLSEDFIREFQHKVDWQNISINQKLSENFIREFQHKVKWDHISEFQILSEDFIREFQDKVNWIYISEYQKLSENFIRDFQDEVDWYCISIKQILSEDFIREYQDKVVWKWISAFQILSDDFIQEFRDKVSIDVKELSWLYKDKEFLKKQVIDCKLYECYDDYFIAYKGIRSDRYSAFNFQYQYLKGETYESHCDCTEEEISFGLSVWTEEEAREYCSELVVKVKVNYEDVGRIVHNNGKIRCRKITILE